MSKYLAFFVPLETETRLPWRLTWLSIHLNEDFVDDFFQHPLTTYTPKSGEKNKSKSNKKNVWENVFFENIALFSTIIPFNPTKRGLWSSCFSAGDPSQSEGRFLYKLLVHFLNSYGAMSGPIRHFWYDEAWKRVVPDREVVTYMNMYSDLLSEELDIYIYILSKCSTPDESPISLNQLLLKGPFDKAGGSSPSIRYQWC